MIDNKKRTLYLSLQKQKENNTRPKFVIDEKK